MKSTGLNNLDFRCNLKTQNFLAFQAPIRSFMLLSLSLSHTHTRSTLLYKRSRRAGSQRRIQITELWNCTTITRRPTPLRQKYYNADFINGILPFHKYIQFLHLLLTTCLIFIIGTFGFICIFAFKLSLMILLASWAINFRVRNNCEFLRLGQGSLLLTFGPKTAKIMDS